MARIEWEHFRHRNEWRGVSERFGRVAIQHSRKAKTYYLLADPWFGERTVLGSYPTLAAAKKAAE